MLAQAAGSGITYHGRLIDPNGHAVVGASVQFRVQLRTPGNENCLMYEELQTKDLSQTDGIFAVTLNDGSGTRTDTSGYAIDQIFSNRGSFTFAAGQCTSGTTYNASATDGRKIQVYFNDGVIPSGQWEAMPAMAVNFVPMAIEAQQIAGYKKDQLLRVADGVSTAQTELSSTSWTDLLALIAGTSNKFVKPTDQVTQLYGASLPAPSNGQSIRWNTALNAGAGGWENFTAGAATSLSVSGADVFSVSSGGLTSVTTGGGLVTTANGTAAAPTFSFAGDPDTGWFRPAANTLAASTSGTERVRISSSGKVGIGTTNPTAKLSIVETNTTASNLYASLIDYTVDVSSAQGAAVKNTGLNINISAGTSNGSSIGKLIGIDTYVSQDWGNSTVNSVLGARFLSYKTSGGAMTDSIGVTTEVGSYSGGTTATQAGFDTFVDTGSGTTTNQYGIRVRDVSTTGGTVTNRYGVYVGSFTGSSTTDNFGFYQAGTSQKNYFAGSVGVGTTSPGQKLEVNGGVRLNTATAKPTCDATSRGTFWMAQGAAGVKDTVEVCAKDAADAYSWRTLY